MKLGVQLFGCSKLYNADPAGFLKRVKAMGYDLVEPCVSFGAEPIPFAWHVDDLKRHADMVREAGLELYSFHSFSDAMWELLPRHIDVCREFGFKRIVLQYGKRPLEKAALDDFAAHCVEAADALAPYGIELWLHNGWPDVKAQVEGVSAHEYLLRACGGKLGSQVDTGWAVCGGAKLDEFLKENAGYIKAIHYKDVATLLDAKGYAENVALGKGIVNNEAAFRLAMEKDLIQIMDQDNSEGDIMEDLDQSAKYIFALAKR